jgi:hypothetical protein
VTPQDKSNAIAAALILTGFAAMFLVMPKIVLGLGAISPWLGGLAALLFVLSFFLLFWLRARYLKNKS